MPLKKEAPLRFSMSLHFLAICAEHAGLGRLCQRQTKLGYLRASARIMLNPKKIRGGSCPPLWLSIKPSLRTARRAPTRIALQARAIPHQREVQALRAHLAFVAFGLGFGAARRG